MDESVIAHQLAQALFKLRLDLKALAAVTDDDRAIARPTGLSINHTAFHDDALAMVRRLSASLVSESCQQLMKCVRLVSPHGQRELRSLLQAIRSRLELIAQHCDAGSFPNDLRMAIFFIAIEAYDLCGVAIQNFAIKNFKKVDS
jgi:hypothetical protein